MSENTNLSNRNFDGGQSSFNRVITNQLTQNNYPKQLPIGRVINWIDSNQYVANLLIPEYGLVPADGIENIWVGPQYSLSYDPPLKLFTLVKNFGSPSTEIIDQEMTLEIAKQLVNTITDQQDILKLVNTEFLSGTTHLKKTTPLQADFVKYEFSPSILGFPVYKNDNSNPFIAILINNANEIQKLTIASKIPIIEPSDSDYQIVGVDQAVKRMKENEASIIFVGEPLLQRINLSNVETTDLIAEKLEYRLVLEQEFATPHYRFFGEIQTDDQNQMTAEILVSALKNPTVLTNSTVLSP